MPHVERENQLLEAITYARENNLCKSGHKALYVHGMMDERPDEFAMKEIINIEWSTTRTNFIYWL